MSLEFAKYYDITTFAKAHNGLNYNDYEKIFVCVDVNDYWIARIMKDINDEYEREEGKFLIERQNIAKEKKDGIHSARQLKKVLDEDDLSNWDNYECDSIEECIEVLDGGFGVKECPYNY